MWLLKAPASMTSLSHYRVLEKLGTGMGIVYPRRRTCALSAVAEILPDNLSNDKQALERFRREALAASALNHANICRCTTSAAGRRPFWRWSLSTAKHCGAASAASRFLSRNTEPGDSDCRRPDAAHAEGVFIGT